MGWAEQRQSREGEQRSLQCSAWATEGHTAKRTLCTPRNGHRGRPHADSATHTAQRGRLEASLKIPTENAGWEVEGGTRMRRIKLENDSTLGLLRRNPLDRLDLQTRNRAESSDLDKVSASQQQI